MNYTDYSNAFKNAMAMKREVIANKYMGSCKEKIYVKCIDEEVLDLQTLNLNLCIDSKSSTPQVCRVKIKEQLKPSCLKNKKIYII